MPSRCSVASRCTLAHAVDFVGELRELEVVSREQREDAVHARDVARDGPRQRQAVVGAGAAPDLVHEDEALVRGIVEDVGRFGHLHHERRAAAGQVVAGADAREDAVDRSEHGALGRHEAAHVRQQHDQRALAHVGALAAHVRAGDHQHAARRVEHQVVGHERPVDEMFDDGMTAAAYLEAGFGARASARSS